MSGHDDFDPGVDPGQQPGAQSSAARGIAQFQQEAAAAGEQDDALTNHRKDADVGSRKLFDRQSEYQRRQYDRKTAFDVDESKLSAESGGVSFRERMAATNLDREQDEVMRIIERRKRDGTLEASTPAEGANKGAPSGKAVSFGGVETAAAGPAMEAVGAATLGRRRRRRRWDADEPEEAAVEQPSAPSQAEAAAALPASGTRRKRSRWDDDDSASAAAGAAASMGANAASATASSAPPVASSAAAGAGVSFAGDDATPRFSAMDETPRFGAEALAGAATPFGAAAADLATPSAVEAVQMAAMQLGIGGAAGQLGGAGAVMSKAEQEMARRNRHLTDEELDEMLPKEGYTVLEPPAGYEPPTASAAHAAAVGATPTPMAGEAGFFMADTPAREDYDVPATPTEGMTAEQLAGAGAGTGGDLPPIRPDDMQFFGPLLEKRDPDEPLTKEQEEEIEILQLLLCIKNGLPPQRRKAMRTITKRAPALGPGPLFNKLLPMLMSRTMEDQEAHLLVKVVDRILYKLGERVRPYAHKVLAAIEPMLIEEDYVRRAEGREIVSNLAKAAGLPTMIATMRPDIDNADEYVRNTTARAFAVVASALGVASLLPFLKAVCASRKSWQARHTGTKIIQQIAILMGCAVLPHLNQLVLIIKAGLTDEEQKVRAITGEALAALAEAAHPYGIHSFDPVLKDLMEGIKRHRARTRAAFLKAAGCIIPLMDDEAASFFTRQVMPVVVKEFEARDESTRLVVLKVVRQCVSAEGVEPEYILGEVMPPFFENFWIRRTAGDRRAYRALVETTVEMGNKVGGPAILTRLVDDFKDDSEQLRLMAIETADKVVANLGVTDVDTALEERLVDGIIFAFQQQAAGEDGAATGKAAKQAAAIVLKSFGTITSALGERVKPYLPQVSGTIKWQLNFKDAAVRQQAADLIKHIAGVMRRCGEDEMLAHLGVVLYESLGEEWPEVLGSLLGGLCSIVAVIGMDQMQPPVEDLVPRLTPILRNQNEKVQENCIDLLGRIADRAAQRVPAKEWMRICFELLELLNAKKKAIRRATINTFGYIAKAIGPQDVLHTLLNNLRVQERTNRLCTTIAIAVVGESCQPFTVLPALMNEYRIPELNVQNGVLKSLSFMFEYVGEVSRDYVYAVTPLLADALMDRDVVHRQTACYVTKHLALGLQGQGCEDALIHLLNHVWPNVLDTSPHVMHAVFEAVEALRVSLGAHRILQYTLQGLFHPARRVREAYWRIYNNAYVYAADQLTPVYPQLEDEPVAAEEDTGVKPQRYTQSYMDLLL